MRNDTKDRLLGFIDKYGPVRPSEMAKEFKLSTQVIHWHLRDLKKKGLVEQIGSPPHTHYNSVRNPQTTVTIPPNAEPIISSQFSYLTPRGELLVGRDAFTAWLSSKDLSKESSTLAKAYKNNIEKIYDHLTPPFSTKKRLETILEDIELADVFIPIVFRFSGIRLIRS